MTAGLDFTGMVPGFDFLQGLMKGAGGGMPGMPAMPAAAGFGQWVAPTLDPAELEKRIQELRTVQFWLEQNAKLLGATIQAMEVQRMTLATLQTMNLPMADLREALSIKPAAASPAAAQASSFPFAAASRREAEQAEPAAAPQGAAQAEPEAPAAPAVDPVKWWGALTQQFTEIANQAIQAGAVASAARPAQPAAAPARAARAAPSARAPRAAAKTKKPAAKARAR